MAVSNLRRANTLDSSIAKKPSASLESSISIQSLTSDSIEPLCDNYPFTNQQSICGHFIYDEPSEYTSGRDIEVNFEYRDGSELLILELNTDVNSMDNIAESLNEILPQELVIYRNLHAPEDALWSFLEQADRILEINILDEGKELPYEDVEGVPREDVIGNYAIENAEVGFSHGDHLIMVRYQGGDLQIETDWEDGREYIIQIFEREVFGNI